MSKHKNLKRNLLICLLAGSAVMYTLPLHAATSVVANNTLPQNGQFFNGNKFIQGTANEKGNGFDFAGIGSITKPNDLTMNVHQNNQNAVIKWDSFDVGGNATVNFTSDKSNFNTLNYVNSGAASQIYGTINGLGGNIYVVNTAGVQIGPSAQINVGSLHVSNKNLDNINWEEINNKNPNINDIMSQGTTGNAALMSLGNINATKVTFEGDGRIVIDSERITNDANNATFRVNTNDAGNVLIGYDAYEETFNGTQANSYKGKDKIFSNVYENGSDTATDVKGYMWVEDVEQLQAINTNLSGNYALRNSIDATATSSWNNNDGFKQIGTEINKAFTGKFDGLDYNIFGLTIKNGGENTGLFGYTNNATISNVTLVGGSITGSNNVGAIVGNANNTTLTNVVNSAAVSGNSNVGGIVGSATNSAIKDAINTGTINGSGDNVGGLIGNLQNSKFIEATDTTKEVEKGLIGNSYNLGDVSGKGHNVGGLVGSASNSTIGDGTNLVYNRMDVTGAYSVGGIVGNMEGSIVKYAENSGTVMATGHTTEYYKYHTGETVKDNLPNDADLSSGIASVKVDVANAGGIAGTSSNNSNIQNVTNSGDVSSSKVERQDYYAAGNVGGVVGKAVDTNIDTATNKENSVRGAHNVGGIAGYFGSSKGDETGENVPRYTVTSGINDGGDIMATGARNVNGFVKEQVRPQNGSNEEFIIGNIGGIVGYMDGNNVYVTGSANRGTVHTSEPADPKNVKDWEKAANVGGIVGKIDRSDTKNKNELGKNYENAAVANSYNTGDVLGYTGVGGVVGMMYNGEVAGSYNLGYLRTTRQSTIGGSIDSLNMGGIVGDTTEGSGSVVLYDVYNKGQIGDSEFNYFGRHVGGIVGRLSGTVEKAYNTGAIYNGYNVVGGIAGWMPNGSIENSFNTGNITVVNNNDATSQVGGIVGAASANKDITINNVYNLGTLRSFKPNNNSGDNAIGGIVGGVNGKGGTVSITNAYTTGNIYAALTSLIGGSNKYYYDRTFSSSDNLHIGSIYSENRDGAMIEVKNTYYIKPALDENNKPLFTELTGDRNNANKAIDFTDKDNSKNYEFDGGITSPDKTNGSVDENSAWRIYNGNTPILNAFLPDSEKYFENDLKDNTGAFTGTIQYGTAYDPLLTIINTDRDLVFNFGTTDNKLSITNAAGLAVYGGGVTLNNFTTSSGSGYFGGTIYADGALNINGVKNDIGIGSAADIYGSAVNIITDGKVTIYGDVTATGNIANGAKGNKEYDEKLPDAPTEIKVENKGDISINAGDVDVYGTLTTGKNVNVPGIEDQAVNTWTPGDVDNPYAEMVDIANRFAHETTNSNVKGDITITANGIADGSGNVNLYFGNKEEGFITTGGNLTVTGTGDVFVDSDLDIAGNVTLTSTGKDGEVLLTLTNIGKVQADRFMDVVESAINGVNLNNVSEDELRDTIFNAVNASGVDNSFTEKDAEIVAKYLIGKDTDKVQVLEQLNNDVAVEYMHDFMHSFDKTTDNYIALNAASGNAKLTVDMWVENSDGSGKFDFAKYDSNFTGTGDGHTFIKELEALEFYINEEDVGNNDKIADASKHVYVEVHNGEQLKGIQDYVDSNVENASDALKFNYALMGDINASDVKDYVAIGTDNANGFTGTFDGHGNRIIGLTVDKVNGQNIAHAGIFSTVGEGGVVKDVNIYSGNFTGSTNAGAVAGENYGRIENIVTFGNTVTATGDANSAGNAGGIVGVNSSGTFTKVEDGTTNGGELSNGIYDVESTGSVIAGSNSAIAGGLVGTNKGGLANSFSDSAVTVKPGVTLDDNKTTALGGVVGVNEGDVQMVDSLGVTNGGDTSSNIGGIIGINNGNMYSGYNESIVSGNDNVGGIIGTNSSEVENVVNATSVTGENKTDAQGDDGISEYVGGLVGSNSGSVTNGRNNGTITGTNYVGGMVGNNAQGATLTNLVNDSSAEILGENYVGGIAGSNAGKITADKENDNLVNRGSITGNKFVGGVAGVNEFGGTIANTLNSVVLHAKGENAQYFGGVVGQNSGEINGATNTSNIDITAVGGSYVGGIIGQNTKYGTLKGEIRNEGSVAGKSQVGGIIGENDNDYVLIGTEGNRLTVENDGSVDAQEGGAAGIFYENHGEIKYADISNSGVVNGGDKTGGTGGLFGINTGNITESTLANSGTVIGGGIVGGLIGKNSGDVSNSSLTNTGSVIGTSDVGGLIGYNTGTVTGGRNKAQETDKDGKVTAEKDSYYKYQIYNNGVVNVGTWNDKNSNGKVDDGEITGLQQGETSQNIGGLIGNNTTENGKTGSLTAGYNTGAINASGSTNVGGIAGSNSGTIDQVFNTVYNTDGTKGAITGGTNVGGLVGTNSGTLSNAYNTTDVSGNYAGTGNAVGVNSGTISNIYATNTTGQLIGSGYDSNVSNAYSFSANEVSSNNVIVISDQDDQKDSGSYDGFDFSAADVDGDVADWKNYDGYSNPLLKVFLTKAEYIVNEDFTYNATDQGLTINSDTINATDKLDAYNNANSLLTATQNKNAGEGYLGIYSQQIAASGKGDTFDPNNLGYDIDVTYDIKKAQLNITLDDVHRVYGNVAITQGGYQISNIDGWQGSDKDLANGITISPANDKGSFEQTDTALTGSNTGKVTENAGGQYTWSADVTLSEEIAQNYEITTTTLTGNSYVEKADLTISIGNAETVYGDAFTNGDYSHTLSGITNGDKADDIDALLGGNYVNGVSVETGKATANAGTYEDKLDFANYNELNNYNIKVEQGDVVVTKADLNIEADNITSAVGNVPKYTGTDIQQGLVNGDTISDTIYNYGVSAGTDVNVEGNYTVGIYVDGSYYELSNPDWSTVTGLDFLKNYNVTFTTGTLTVTEQVMPDLPDNWPNNRWDYLFGDNPFDRNENFRERKAEVNFVDGAMEI